MNNLYFYLQVKSLPNGSGALGVVFMLLSWISPPLVQANSLVREVQNIEREDLEALGVLNPVGLLASPRIGEVFILDKSQTETPAAAETKIKSVNLDRSTVSSSASLPSDIVNSINTVFDEKNNRIFGLLADNERLIEIGVDNQGILERRGFSKIDISSMASLQNPQGMAVDPQTGTLYILDSGKIIRLEPEVNSGDLADARVIEVNLPAFFQ